LLSLCFALLCFVLFCSALVYLASPCFNLSCFYALLFTLYFVLCTLYFVLLLLEYAWYAAWINNFEYWIFHNLYSLNSFPVPRLLFSIHQ
jgi:hypothetical protein